MDYQGEFTGPQIDARLTLAESAYQKPATGIPATDLSEGVQELLQEAGTAYQKPANGIPASDLAEGVQESLQRGDSAYQKPVEGIPASDLAEGVQESLARANTAYQKPASGIPKTDLAEGVQQSLDNGDNAIAGVNGILPLIPSAASALNKLADQALVQHLVQLMQASFCGNWDEWNNVPTVAIDFPKTPDNNDYLVVLNAYDYAPLYSSDATYNAGDIRTYNGLLYKALQDNFSGILPTDTDYWEEVSENPKYAGSWIFKYVPVDETYNKYNWFPEFKISDVPFTQEQMASINSGINALLVAKLTNLPVKPVDTAAQSLSDAEKLQARTNIGATAPEVFIAIYGTTTVAEIDAAYAANKEIILFRTSGGNTLIYHYVGRIYGSSSYDFLTFVSHYNDLIYYVRLKSDAGTWDAAAWQMQTVANRKSSWSATPSDTNYPSEKLVYDSIYIKGKVSQTITWSGSYGDMTYTLSNVVEGNIPMWLIEQAQSFGATFNSATGYFEFGGYDDIAADEMKDAIAKRSSVIIASCYNGRTDRILLPGITFETSNASIFQGCAHIRTIPQQYGLAMGVGGYCFYSCWLLRRIDAKINGDSTGLPSTNAFSNCPNLEYINIYRLKRSLSIQGSPNFLMTSLLEIIQGEAATSAITITLHATAYARAIADADITAALSNHPNVSLASA